MHSVTWHDVVKWCNARTEREHQYGRGPCYTVFGSIYRTGEHNNVVCNTSAGGYRLPTNTEWEYAARGGLSGKRFSWGDTIDHTRANYYSYWYDGAPFYPYDSGYQGSDTRYQDAMNPYTSPVGSFAANGYGLHDVEGNVYEWCWDSYPGVAGASRLLHGGCWDLYAEHCRVGRRSWGAPDYRDDIYGFRACYGASGQ